MLSRLDCDEPHVCRLGGQDLVESRHRPDVWHDGTSTLCSRRRRNAREPGGQRRTTQSGRNHDPARRHGNDARHTKGSRVANHGAQLVPLHDPDGQCHDHGSFNHRLAWFEQVDVDGVAIDSGNACEPFVATTIEDPEFGALGQSKDVAHVMRVGLGKADARCIRVWHKTSMCRHGYRYTLHRMVFRGQALGKYRILEPLGSGGFGTVYLAEDTWIDKRVAIKVPHKQTLDFGELLREPRLLAALNHPNIVTVTTAEKQDGVFFIVMEYVPGDTLETIILERGPLDLSVALDYACQILNAVDHAHRQNVIHRDLRPANVFVGDRGILKVGDFGTSRFLELAAQGTTVIGSPPYMAPEQFEGRAVFGSDLYSVGVTMYQMLTGRLPYEMPVPSELDKLRTGELVHSARLVNPSIPTSIDSVILKALRPRVEDRYQQAEDVLQDILAARRDFVRRPAPTPDVVSTRPVLPARGVGELATRTSAARPPAAEAVANRFCWHCRKPLPSRAGRCPFCGESQ